MDWKFVSDDIDSISLHDCDITAWEFGEKIALLFGDGFDVCAENPLNGTGRHKRTGKAAVVLKNGKLISAEYPECTDRNDKIVPAEEISLNELLKLELETTSFEYESGILTLECYVWEPPKSGNSFCVVKLSCDELLFCWNEFTDDAWFQEK